MVSRRNCEGMRPVIVVPRSILICNIRLIGDVVLTTPLIGLLKQQYPDVEIDLLVNRGTGEFLEKDPRVNRVIYSEKWQRSGSKKNRNNYLMNIIGRYDWSICLNASDRGNLAVALAARQVRLGFYEDSRCLGALWRKALLSHPLPFDEEQHVGTRCCQIAKTLGVPVERLEVKVFWNSADSDIVQMTMGETCRSRGYFVVHPFARWRYKYWDIKRFAEVSDYVSRQYGLQPVWTSSPDESEIKLLEAAAVTCAVTPLLVPGTFTLNQMACLLDGASLYIGLDTAITHIAAATGVPTLALYGPTEIWRWHPWDNAAAPGDVLTSGYRGTFRSGNVVALQAACEHYPCIRPRCYANGLENPCMMALRVNCICAEVDLMLQRYNVATG